MSNGRNLGLLLGSSTIIPTSALSEVSNLVDSDYITQLSPVKVTTANQSFDSNQETLLNLTAEISGVPNVAVFKEVPQTGFTSKSNWDVNSTASNYDFYNEATTVYAGASITPSNSSTDGIFTLSTGTFTSQDIGKRVVGNGGEAIISATDGSYSLVTPFNDTSTITAGNWGLFALKGDSNGIYLNSISLRQYDGSTSVSENKTFVPNIGSLRTFQFSTDGSKLIITTSGSTLYYYNLSTPWDITTAISSGSLNHGRLMSSDYHDGTVEFFFTPDGNKLFLFYSTMKISSGTDILEEYDCNIPWHPTVITLNTSQNLTTSDYNFYKSGMTFSPNGNSIYLGGYLYRIDLNTPYTMSNGISIVGQIKNIQGSPYGFGYQRSQFSQDGEYLYMIDPYSFKRGLHTVGPLINSGVFTSSDTPLYSTTGITAAGSTFNSFGFYVQPGGGRWWNSNSTTIYSYQLGSNEIPKNQYIPAITNSIGRINTTSWLDINDMTPDETLNDGEVYYAISTDARTTWKVAKNGEGERSIARNNSGTWQYNSNANETTVYTGYDLDGNLASTLSSFTSISGDTGVTYLGTGFSSDGTNMYAFSPTDYTFYQFTLSTPWDETTASYANKSFTPSSGNNWQVHLIRFDPTGTKMYAGGEGQTRNTLYEYTLSTPWDISTANPTATDSLPTRNVAGVTGEVENIIISPNGSYVYALNYQTGTLHRWTLNTAWNLSSRTSNSPDQTTSSLYTWSTFSWGLDISDDGTKLYVTNGNPVGLGEWSLSPAYSISGLSTSPNTSSAWSGAAYKNLVIGKQGLKLYATGAGGVAHQDMGNSSISSVYGLTETWTNSTYNNEHAALQQALTVSINRMNSTQLSELSDANEFVLGNSLDLMIAPYVSSGTSPVSDGVTINYDAEAIIRQAILGTDYIVEQPSPGTIKVVSLTSQNLKIRVL